MNERAMPTIDPACIITANGDDYISLSNLVRLTGFNLKTARRHIASGKFKGQVQIPPVRHWYVFASEVYRIGLTGGRTRAPEPIPPYYRESLTQAIEAAIQVPQATSVPVNAKPATMVHVDHHGRANLGSLVEPNSDYRVSIDRASGIIIIEPVVVLSKAEYAALMPTS